MLPPIGDIWGVIRKDNVLNIEACAQWLEEGVMEMMMLAGGDDGVRGWAERASGQYESALVMVAG